MPDLVVDGAEFSCNFCTCKLKLSVTSSSTKADSKKVANQLNCLCPPPPGGMCSFPAGVPPSPCPGVPPGLVIATGQSVVKVDNLPALGDGAKMMCPKGQILMLSSPGQSVAKHNEAEGADDASIWLEVLAVLGAVGILVLSRGKVKTGLARAAPLAKRVASAATRGGKRTVAAIKNLFKKSPSSPKAEQPKAVPETKPSSTNTKPETSQPIPKTEKSPTTKPEKPKETELNQSPPKEKSLNEKKIERYKENIDNQKEHLTQRDLDAARRELNGEIVATKRSGEPFDHVHEVRDAKNGLRNTIISIKKELPNTNLSASERQQLQDVLSEASKLLDKAEEFVP